MNADLMFIKSIALRLTFRIGLALLFSIAICLLPWEQLRGLPFEDLEVYLDKFLIGDMLIENPDSDFGFVWYFTNEVLWDFLIRYAVDSLLISVEGILLAVSVTTVFCFSLVILSRKNWWALLVLVNPLIIDFSMSQVRMAFAVSILFLALAVRGKFVAAVLAFSALLVHSASVLFVLFYALIKYLPFLFEKVRVRFSLKFLSVIIGLSTCVIIGPMREVLLGYLGDRRAEYAQVPASSIAYALFWGGFLVVMLFQRKKYFDFWFLQSQKNTFGPWFRSSGDHFFVSSYLWPVNALSVVCLTIFVFGTLFNIPVIRFISASFPLLAISFLEIKGLGRIIIWPVGGVFVALQWWYWFL